MSPDNIKIEGLDELMKAFAALGEEALPYLKEGADQAGSLVLDKTISMAPEDTGNLKKKLKLGKAKKSSKYPYRVFSKVTFTQGASYAVPVELGHKLVINGNTVGTIKERPFMRPAADACRSQSDDIMIGAMNKALEQMGGKK